MDKTRQFAVPSSKNIKSKFPSTGSAASSSRKPGPPVTKASAPSKLNTTVIGFEEENRQIAYGRFLRAMLEECILDERIEREETEMDVQMALLTDRFQKTMDQLDKTSRRLKDINFVVEQKRLLNLKNVESTSFYTTTENSNAEELLKNLNNTEQTYLNRLETKNIDFGYNKDSGHRQLLDAVNDAINGLDNIKKHSKLDISKFQEYEKSQKNLEELERAKLELNNAKSEFEGKFPEISEKFIKEASDKIARLFDEDNY